MKKIAFSVLLFVVSFCAVIKAQSVVQPQLTITITATVQGHPVNVDVHLLGVINSPDNSFKTTILRLQIQGYAPVSGSYLLVFTDGRDVTGKATHTSMMYRDVLEEDSSGIVHMPDLFDKLIPAQ